LYAQHVLLCCLLDFRSPYARVQAQIPLYKLSSAMAKVIVVKFKPQGSLGVRLVLLIGNDLVGASFGPEKSRFMPCT
jgi:hypothetical protein